MKFNNFKNNINHINDFFYKENYINQPSYKGMNIIFN